MNEAVAPIRSALVTALGHPRIYKERAPTGTAYPYVTLHLIDSDEFDEFSGGNTRMELWSVRVVSQNKSEARTGATAVEAALNDAELDLGAAWHHLKTYISGSASRLMDQVDIDTQISEIFVTVWMIRI